MTDTSLTVPVLQAPSPEASESRSFPRTVLRRLRYDYLTLAFLGVILVIAFAAVFAPWIAPYDPNRPAGMLYRLRPIGHADFILGTDELGRDMLSRLIYGARMALILGLTPVAIATLVGGTLGIVAGYAGGWLNALIMRTMDVFYAFPSVLLAVAISGTMGGGIGSGLLALTLVFIPPLCRIAETASSQVRNLDYIEAARASGASAAQVIFHHVLGNVLAPILIYASSLISVAILLGAGLSFLGLGVEPPTADWGLMLSSLRQSIYVQPMVCALPGFAIFITSLSFNIVSDGLRQAMDIRS